jgi:hypothetical protein
VALPSSPICARQVPYLSRGTVPGCGRRAIVNAWIGHREHPDQFIVNGKIGFVNARIGDREQLDRSS